MTIDIPDQVIRQTGLSAQDILLKVAITLFQEEKLTLGQASKLAGVHQFELQLALATRNIPLHYDETQYLNDLRTNDLIK